MKTSRMDALKNKLADALIKLMKKKSFDEISICEICQTAGVGRTTFYRRLDKQSPKEDLIKFKIVHGYEMYRSSLKGKTDDGHNVLAYLYSIKDQILLFLDNNLLNVVMDAVQTIVVPEIDAKKGAAYVLSFLTYGFFGVIRQWVKFRLDDTPEEVEARFQKIVSKGGIKGK